MPKNLTVRLDEGTRKTLEAIASVEMRTLANQISYFVRQGMDAYLKEKNYSIDDSPFEEGAVILRGADGLMVE